jgi:bifunctional non-homologous end joining protein LigD
VCVIPFDHPDWIFELKHDGFRALAYISERKCRLVSRKESVFKSFSPLCEALSKLPVKNAILDGELVCLDSEGNSLFKQLLYRKDV